MTRYLAGPPVPDITEQAARLARIVKNRETAPAGTGFWALETKDGGDLVGAVLLKALPLTAGGISDEFEVGWHLRRDCWGHGYATEAAHWAVRRGLFELGLAEIYAILFAENVRSARVADRLGMQRVGETSQYYGVTVDLYSLSR